MTDQEKKEAVEYQLGVEQPVVFEIMRALRLLGLKILNPQNGREFHALINLPAFGLTRGSRSKKASGHLGFIPNRINQEPPLPTNVLIDEKQDPYPIEAILFVHGQANWKLEADIDTQWILMVTDAIDVDDYIRLVVPVVQGYPVDLIVTPLLRSLDEGVHIDPATIIDDSK